MTQASLPLLLFGDADNFDTAWTKVNSPTVVAGITDPFGGTSAYTIQDDSGAATEYLQKTVTLESGITRCALWFFVNGASLTSVINWRDTTAGADRRTVRITFDAFGGATLTSLAGSATLDQAISFGGGGFYLIRIGVASILTANTNVLQIMPAATTTADTASTGTLKIYRRSLVSFARPLDDPTSWTMARPGSSIRQISSGLRDAWNFGDTQHLTGSARFIPPSDWDAYDASTGAVVVQGTGWDGRGEEIATNVGFDALYRAASDATLMRWMGNRAVSPVSYVDCYLEPLSGAPVTERRVLSPSTGLIAMRTAPINLVSYGDLPFEGY